MVYTKSQREGGSESQKAELPDDTKKAYVVGRQNLSVRIDGTEDWLDLQRFEDIDTEEEPYIVFECGESGKRGDQLPLEVVRDCYEAFGDSRIQLTDGNEKSIPNQKLEDRYNSSPSE